MTSLVFRLASRSLIRHQKLHIRYDICGLVLSHRSHTKNAKTKSRSPETSQLNDIQPEASSVEVVLDNWVCSKCGVQSFSWRTSCFCCGSAKPIDHSQPARAPEIPFAVPPKAAKENTILKSNAHNNTVNKSDVIPNTEKHDDTAPSAPPAEGIAPLLSAGLDGALGLFGNSRPGDWVCPGCGSLCFAGRDTCFRCGTLKPDSLSGQLVRRNGAGVTNAPKKRRGQKATEEEVTPLKDILELSERARDFDSVVAAAEKRLQSKEPLKASVMATIIRAFGKAKRFDRALEIFNSIGAVSVRKRPTTYHFAAILTACADNARWQEALEILDRMRGEKRSRPNCVVYTAAMTACAKAGQWKECIDIFDTIVTERVPLDTTCYNAAIAACSHTRQYSKAFDIFDEMLSSRTKLDEVTYGAMLLCCDKAGDWVLANDLLKRVKASKRVTLNEIMITSAMGAFVRGGEPQRALDLFDATRAAQKETSMLLTYPIYSAALRALGALSELQTEARGKDAPMEDENGGRGGPHTMQALQLLREMARRHVKVTPLALATAIRVMDAEGAFSAAQEVYDLGVQNKLFTDSAANIDDDRRIDLRESHPSMVRAVLRSTLAKIYKGEFEIQDLLIVLGNRNKAQHELAVSVVRDNIFAGNPIEPVQSLQDGTVVRVTGRALQKWISRGSGAGRGGQMVERIRRSQSR